MCLTLPQSRRDALFGHSKPCLAMTALIRAILIARLALEGICLWVTLSQIFLQQPRGSLACWSDLSVLPQAVPVRVT